MQKTRQVWWWLIPVLLIAFGVAVRQLEFDIFFIDEMTSVFHLGMVNGTADYLDVIASIAKKSPQHTPAYFLLLRTWTYATGYTPFALRLLATLIGIVAIAWTYRLVHEMTNPEIGLTAAIMLASAAIFSFYQHEVRMYTMLVLLTVILIWLYRRLIQMSKAVSVWWWIALFLVTLTLLYTHVFAVFPVFGVGIHHLLFAKKNRRWWQISMVMGVAGLLYLPWVPVLLEGNSRMSVNAIGLSLLEITWTAPYQASNQLLWLYGLLLVAAFVLRLRRYDVRLMATVTLATLAGILALQMETQIISVDRTGRYFLVMYPMLLFFAAVGLQVIPWRSVRGLVLVVWVVAGFRFEIIPYVRELDMNELYVPFPELRETFLREDVLNGSDIVFLLTDHPDWAKMDYYAGYYFAFLPGGQFVVNPETLAHDEPADPGSVSAHVASAPILWLAYAPERLSQETISTFTQLLANTHQPCGNPIETTDLTIQRYAQPSFGCETEPIPETALVTYREEAIQLAGMLVTTEGDTGLVAAAWQIDGSVPLHTYSASWQLFDSAGEKVRQVDYELPASSSIWRMARFDLSDLPSGDYQVRLIAYNWQTGDKLSETTNTETIVTVGQFKID